MTVEHSVAFIFPDFDAATQARERVLSGHDLAPDDIWIDLREDEAGPTEGNFVIGTKRHDGKQTGDYKEQYADPRIDGSVVLFVRCISREQAEAMNAALRAEGATSLDDRTAGHRDGPLAQP